MFLGGVSRASWCGLLMSGGAADELAWPSFGSSPHPNAKGMISGAGSADEEPCSVAGDNTTTSLVPWRKTDLGPLQFSRVLPPHRLRNVGNKRQKKAAARERWHKHVTGHLFPAVLSCVLLAALSLLVYILLTISPALSPRTDQLLLLQERIHTNIGTRGLLQKSEDFGGRGIDLEKVPRWNLDFQPVSPEFDPQNSDYLTSLAMWIAVGVLAALVVMAYGMAFCFCRCCHRTRRCCGGRTPQENFCVAGPLKSQRYTKCEIWWPAIAIMVIAAGTTVVFIIGFVGNEDLGESVLEILDILNGTSQQARQILNELVCLVAEAEEVISPDPIQSAYDTVRELQEQVESIQGYVRVADYIRKTALICCLSVSIALAVCAIVAFFFSCGWLAAIAAAAGFVNLWLLWLVFGIHFPVALMFSDLCRELDDFFEDSSNQVTSSHVRQALNAMLDCEKEKQGLRGLRSQVNDLFDTGLTKLSRISGLPVTPSSLPQFLDMVARHHVVVSRALRDAYSKVLKVKDALDRAVELADCGIIDRAFSDMRLSLCTKGMRAANLLWISFLTLALMYIPLIAFATLGYKRFKKWDSWKQNRRKKDTLLQNGIEMQEMTCTGHQSGGDSLDAEDMSEPRFGQNMGMIATRYSCSDMEMSTMLKTPLLSNQESSE